MPMWKAVTRTVPVLCALFVLGMTASAQDTRYFTIATGSTAGTYFPVGSLIAAAISRPVGSSPCDQGGACGVDGLIATAVTTLGSFDNIEGIAEGRFDSGLAQADIVAWAYHGEQVFTGKSAFPNLRVIANLYPEHVHLVARKELGVKSVADLDGRWVAIDREGSGTRINALLILHAYGVDRNSILAISAGPEGSITGLLDGDIDAAFFVVGYPSTAVTELMETGKFDLVPIGGVPAAQLEIANPYFETDVIPAAAYGTETDIETVTVGAQLVTHADMSVDLVRDITEALWRENNRSLLGSGHVQARRMSAERAVKGVTIPFHPGARLYYEEKGLLK
ncbi:MAG: TAXI family TRAP transporter solute-binding subunit [Minwuia sp.]|uniref:TAXI family TRAP transporter solute-binding subunit n=1 Tax=Minwuia sp. TaxID=2493630 RepID=UPI003A8B6166